MFPEDWDSSIFVVLIFTLIFTCGRVKDCRVPITLPTYL